jgi:hypothetical protein
MALEYGDYYHVCARQKFTNVNKVKGGCAIVADSVCLGWSLVYV